MAWMDYQDDQGLKENQVCNCNITVNCVIMDNNNLFIIFAILKYGSTQINLLQFKQISDKKNEHDVHHDTYTI